MKQLLLGLLIFTHTYSFSQRHIFKVDGSSITILSIDSIVTSLMDSAKVPGLNLAILNYNKIAYIKSYGYKNNRTKERLDTGTIFYGASFSKAVFAYLSMRLVQKGILSLDTPLYKYLEKPLPEYDNYKDLKDDDRWKLITARMCLSHTTGFPNWRFLNAKTGNYDRNGKLAMYFPPGTRYAYSGEGLILLQMVIEEKTRKSLEELAKSEVFEPLQMFSTSYVWESHFENDYALGSDEEGNVLDKKKRTKANAAGSLETTIADYSRFIQAVMQGKGLKPFIKQLMVTPQIRIYSKYQFPTITEDTTSENNHIQLSYGLGWGLLNTPYGKAFFKEGHDEGWQHYNINFVKKGISIIIMTNSSNGEKIFKDLLKQLIGDVFTPWKWERYVPYDLK